MPYCPKCEHDSFTVDKRGFDAGKAVAGGLVGSLLGPVGAVAGAALGGTANQNETEFVCNKCGHRFPPSQAKDTKGYTAF